MKWPRVMCHMNTLQEYLKISHGAMHMHSCKNEVLIEHYG